MLLSYHDLVRLVDAGVINADYENINGASIDVTLHDTILIERDGDFEVDLSRKQSLNMIETTIEHYGFPLLPGMFVLAATDEIFNLPNDIACEFKLKSSAARAGLNNMLATWADPLWSNSRLTLELHNCTQCHTLILRSGMKIGQMIFYRVKSVPYEHSYAVKGRYNNTTRVTASKGV